MCLCAHVFARTYRQQARCKVVTRCAAAAGQPMRPSRRRDHAPTRAARPRPLPLPARHHCTPHDPTTSCATRAAQHLRTRAGNHACTTTPTCVLPSVSAPVTAAARRARHPCWPDAECQHCDGVAARAGRALLLRACPRCNERARARSVPLLHESRHHRVGLSPWGQPHARMSPTSPTQRHE